MLVAPEVVVLEIAIDIVFGRRFETCVFLAIDQAIDQVVLLDQTLESWS